MGAAIEELMIRNIKRSLKRQKKKQSQLAEAMQVPRQTVSKILTGCRTMTAAELKLTADFLDTSMDSLLKDETQETTKDYLQALIRRAPSREAEEGIRIAAEIIAMYPKQEETRA